MKPKNPKPDAPGMGEVTDPVCGMAFEEAGALELGARVVDHGGKRFWFCCPTCEEQFGKEPAKYGG